MKGAVDPRQDKEIEKTILSEETVAIPLTRFACYVVHVDQLRRSRQRTEFERDGPTFYFFTPDGELVRKLARRSARSPKYFRRAMSETWAKSFTLGLDRYLERFREVLDLEDEVCAKERLLDERRTRLKEKQRPTRSEQRKLDEDRRELAELKKRARESRMTLENDCTLRPRFLTREVARTE
jgi:hypothetical protein